MILFLLFGLFRSVTRTNRLVYYFVIVVLFIASITFLLSGGDLSTLPTYFSSVRRLTIPFASFLIFCKFVNIDDRVEVINRALLNLYWIVFFFQIVDFAAMQLSESYRDVLIGLSNSANNMTDKPLMSHIVIFEWQSVRAFGILLNFHGSGLLLLFLFLYKLFIKGFATMLEVICMAIGVVAGGSLQNLACLIALFPLLLANQQVVRYVIAIVGVPAAVISIAYFSVNPLFHFGTVYIFEYTTILANVFLDLVSRPDTVFNILFGFGNLRLSDGSWSIPGISEELGDIGLFRLILESGLVAVGLWLLLCFRLGNIHRAKRQLGVVQDTLRVRSLLAIPAVGILSLAHYPVLFLPANMTLFMLALAIISCSAFDLSIDGRRSNRIRHK